MPVAEATTPNATHANRLLDVIRGLSALLVVAGHARATSASMAHIEIADLATWQKIALVPTSFAQEAVGVFFVLSGYLVGGQVMRQVREGRFSWGAYAAKRLSRMWTVLLPGLLLTAGLDAVGGRFFPVEYANALDQKPDGLVAASCNALFLQMSRCEEYGTNLSLWSLSYEFWFYLIFAAGTVACFAAVRGRALLAGLNVLTVVAALTLFGVQVLPLMLAWLVGVAVAEVQNRHSAIAPLSGRRAAWLLLTAVALLGLTFLATDALHLGRLTLTLAVSVPSGLLIFAALQDVPLPRRLEPCVSALGRLGDWSFSMYVFHLPLIVLSSAIIQRNANLNPAGLVPTTYLLTALILVLIPLLWFCTERHTPLVRRILMSLLSRERPSVPTRGT